jgi:hypothetical protein
VDYQVDFLVAFIRPLHFY